MQKGTEKVRLILQRVRSSSVTVEGRRVAAISRGLLVLVGIERGDTIEQVEAAADKLVMLRVFEDEQGKMNRSIQNIDGSFLLVSQFTLAASLAKGRRPSFDRAERPERAAELIEQLARLLRQAGVEVETGEFGAYMLVELVNDGPVTFLLEFPPPPAD